MQKRSPPVLCILGEDAKDRGFEPEPRNRDGLVLEAFAMHDTLSCIEGYPCVILWKGSNEENILSLLTHESIHHALRWLGEDDFIRDDHFDEFCPTIEHQKRLGI